MRLLLSILMLALPTPALAQAPWSLGQGLFDTVFDPARNFPGLKDGYDEQLILTAQISARDDYLPEISLAIAYRCLPIAGDPVRCQPTFTARMLRTGSDETAFARSGAMLVRLSKARGDSERRAALDASDLEWVEADLLKCEGGLEAFDAVRKADWSPDLHYRMREEPEIIMHPAMIRVMVRGDVTTTSYRGWVLAGGVPAAVRALIAVLDKCWTPSKAPKPWASGPVIR